MTTLPSAASGPSRLRSAAFTEPNAAERAIGALLDHGVHARQISVASRYASEEGVSSADTVLADRSPDGFLEVQTDDPATPTDMNAATDARRGAGSTNAHPESVIEAEGERTITTTTSADAVKGAVEGSMVGLGIGLLAGAAALFVPGIGLIAAAGPLWTALAGTVGATASGAVAGGVTGYLKDMGVSDTTAAAHAQTLAGGSVIVIVHLEPENDPAAVTGLLHKYGGMDLSENGDGLHNSGGTLA